MIRSSFLLIAIATLIGTATGAVAQKVGTYSGTSADGSFMSFSVTKNGGVFSFTNGDVNFQAACKNPVRTAFEGWGFYLGQDIVHGVNDFHSADDYYDVRGTMTFVSDNKIKGTVTSVTAVFVPGNDPPDKAQFCKSPKQAFTLTFQTAPTSQAAPQSQPVTAVVLQKQKIN
jgi:hypothetical protein